MARYDITLTGSTLESETLLLGSSGGGIFTAVVPMPTIRWFDYEPAADDGA